MIRAAPLGVKKRAKNDPNFDGVQLKSVGCPKNDGQNRSKNRSSLPAPLQHLAARAPGHWSFSCPVSGVPS